jgi:hypothetical protein
MATRRISLRTAIAPGQPFAGLRASDQRPPQSRHRGRVGHEALAAHRGFHASTFERRVKFLRQAAALHGVEVCVEASNIGGAPMTKDDRKRIAEYLYGAREWTMERIAKAPKKRSALILKTLLPQVTTLRAQRRTPQRRRWWPQQETRDAGPRQGACRCIPGAFEQRRPASASRPARPQCGAPPPWLLIGPG